MVQHSPCTLASRQNTHVAWFAWSADLTLQDVIWLGWKVHEISHLRFIWQRLYRGHVSVYRLTPSPQRWSLIELIDQEKIRPRAAVFCLVYGVVELKPTPAVHCMSSYTYVTNLGIDTWCGLTCECVYNTEKTALRSYLDCVVLFLSWILL